MWRKKTNRLIRVFTPFFLLLVVTLVLNLKIESIPFFQHSPVQAIPEVINQPVNDPTSTSLPVVGGSAPISTAIANATAMPTTAPEPTVEPTPTKFARDLIALIGPPEESRFSLSTPLSFYWFSDKQPAEGESYKLFLINDSIEKLVGTVSEPNMGRAYQVNFIPEDTGLAAGEYFWKVIVTVNEDDQILGESELRSIMLVEAKG